MYVYMYMCMYRCVYMYSLEVARQQVCMSVICIPKLPLSIEICVLSAHMHVGLQLLSACIFEGKVAQYVHSWRVL